MKSCQKNRPKENSLINFSIVWYLIVKRYLKAETLSY